MIWILLTFLACSEQPIDCEGLDEQACEEAEGCYPIDGRPIYGDYDCYDVPPKEYAGCRTPGAPMPEPCAEREVIAHPPGVPDECWYFGDDCIPDGWPECAPCP